MLLICSELFSAFDNAGIVYCHWKGNLPSHLEKGLNGDSDLDIIVSESSREVCLETLKSLLFVKCKSQLGARFYDLEDWIGFDYESGKLVHVHLHFRLATGGKWLKEYSLPWLTETLETRVKSPTPGIYVMNPSLELFTLYTRVGIKASRKAIREAKKGVFDFSNCFKRDLREEIAFLKKDCNLDFINSLADKYYGKDSEKFSEIVFSDSMNADQFVCLCGLSRRMLSKFRVCSPVKSCICNCYLSVIVPSIRKMNSLFGIRIQTRKVISNNKGLSIAFIGQDGAGKSTVTHDILQWIQWKIEASSFYLGSGDGYKSLLKSIIGRLSKKTEEEHSIKNTLSSIPVDNTIKKVSIKRKIANVLSALKYKDIAKHAYKEACKANLYCNKGAFALYDRFPQVQFFGIYDGPKIAAPSYSGFCSAIVKYLASRELHYLNKIQDLQPNLCFKLILPAEESMRRKPFENREQVFRKAQITRELVFNNSDTQEVDATQSYTEELLCIKRIIWRCITT